MDENACAFGNALAIPQFKDCYDMTATFRKCGYFSGFFSPSNNIKNKYQI